MPINDVVKLVDEILGTLERTTSAKDIQEAQEHAHASRLGLRKLRRRLLLNEARETGPWNCRSTRTTEAAYAEG